MSGALAVTSVGDGPAVLWLHGYTMTSQIWGLLWRMLPGRRHLGVDLPGHGRSPAMRSGLTLPEVGDQVAELAELHGARDVVGLSFGSSIALQVVIDHPAVLDRLVLAAPTISGATDDPDSRQCYRELALLERGVGPGALMTARWMQSPPDIFRGTAAHPGLRAVLERIVGQHSWRELRNGAMQSLTAHRQLPEELASITADTQVLVGTDDMPAFLRNAELLEGTVPRCEVHRIPGTGHLPLLERPDLVAPILDRFLPGLARSVPAEHG